jgi:hypothetical protein
MSAKYDITAENLEKAGYRAIHAGDDYDHAFTVTRAGSALDLNGAILWFTIKEDSALADDEAKLQLQTPTQIEVTDAAQGKFTVRFDQDATKNLEGEWPYDIKCKLQSGSIIRLSRGVIQFLANLTRATA